MEELKTSDYLKGIVLNLPESPGVYQYLNTEGTIIYVGKAKNLKRRVSSYFNREHEPGKTRVLVSKIADIRYIVVNTEEDALLLENNLIKKYKPRYNVLLKDDKTYPSICVQNEYFPRVFKTRRVIRNGSSYYGPYSHIPSMYALLDLIKHLYPLRTCNLNLSPENIRAGKFNVCLEYHIKNCAGPCVGKQSQEEYLNNIAEIKEILKGNTQEVGRMLYRQMQDLAAEMKFEEAQKINLYVSTSTFCQTKYDPYVNLLRAATQSFSAVVGGMDGMYVKPFDHCIRPSDVFSRRIARNIQIMEQHEFNFIQPIDPSGGSWYIEPLTEEFTEKTWAKFQEIESHGGLLAALESGKVQAAVKAILEERFKNLATRKDRAVGNNMYPNMTEELLEVPEVDFAGILKARKTDLEVNVKVRDNAYVEAVLSDLGKRDASELGSLIADAEKALLAGATMGEISAALTGSANGEKVEAIAPHRWTERYEELRMRTENFVDKTGANVKIFLANMGPIPQHKARADFVTSFMQVAAFEVVTNNGFLTVEEAVKAALESGADAAIVCSTDATYPELAPAVTKGIKAVNPEMKVFLAGAPSAELKEICDAAGMDDYISVKSNCYETLLRMQKERGMF